MENRISELERILKGLVVINNNYIYNNNNNKKFTKY
jgi:hypothetical protein